MHGAAALLSGLDAFVTAPTNLATLAGAVGTPTFKILAQRPWLSLGCDYEPMAPAARLMLPDAPGDWAGAFAKTRDALVSNPWVQLEA